MSDKNAELVWKEYVTRELEKVTPILKRHGYRLEDVQPHIGGERYLMQAVTTESGRKLILLGRGSDNRRVLIKATSDNGGIHELDRERMGRELLKKINFAYHTFLSPEEVAYLKEEGFVILITAFIEQERTFLERPLQEQFGLALSAFKAQESAHATTSTHLKAIQGVFETLRVNDYLKKFGEFRKNTLSRQKNPSLRRTLNDAELALVRGAATIAQYEGFLTHVDFVPHNIRIVGRDIYLLDHSSLRFGNKYEGWARFLNFMMLYNPPLEEAFTRYVRDNRTPEELESLKLMRMYRLGEIIYYYTRALEKSSGNLHTLNEKRVTFWGFALEAVLKNAPLRPEVIAAYQKVRDELRSPEERERQKGLH